MKKIIVSSKNPVKLKSAENAFKKMFPQEEFYVESAPVKSGVGEQPMSDNQTLEGALSRSKQIKKLYPDADFWIGLEGGVEEKNDGLECFAWAIVIGKNLTGKARTAAFSLPPRVSELIKQGYELSKADDIVFNRENSKHQNGAVGLLTGDVIDRAMYYEHALILALIPFKNKSLY